MSLVNVQTISSIKRAYQIAVIPGDGIGTEVIAAGVYLFYDGKACAEQP